MIKVDIQLEDVLQGHCRFAPVNLFLFFQVNCPGCFTYAIPETIKIHEANSDWLQVFGVATAFENLDLNTAENARAFLWTGELVGEPKEVFSDLGLEKYPHEIPFPVLADKIVNPADYMEEQLERLCGMFPGYTDWADTDRKALEIKLREYVKAYPKAGFSFVFNMLRGTPSWLLTTEDLTLLGTWYGHDTLEDMKATLQEIREDIQNSGK